MKNLKYIRKSFGFTMRDLAKRINVSANAINLWENGDINISETNENKLVELFGIEKQLFYKETLSENDKLVISKARYLNELTSNIELDIIREISSEELEYIRKIKYCINNKENNILCKHIINMLDDIN